MSTLSRQASFGLPTTVTKLGQDQKGPAAYVVEQTKYKALFSGTLCLITAFAFLYMAYLNERSVFDRNTEQLFRVEEHQRLQKQSAELKLLQVIHMLAAHLEQEKEEELEMRMLYVSILGITAKGTDVLENSMADGKEKQVAMAVHYKMMHEVSGIVGRHEREARARGDSAKALLNFIHNDTINELKHEVDDDIDDSYIEEGARYRQLNVDSADLEIQRSTVQSQTSMLKYLQGKAQSMDTNTSTQADEQWSSWDGLLKDLEGKAIGSEHMRKVESMVTDLPSALRLTPYAHNLARLVEQSKSSESGSYKTDGVLQVAVFRYMRMVAADLKAHLPAISGELRRTLSEWEAGPKTAAGAHKAFLRLETMVQTNKIPAVWLAESATEVHPFDAGIPHRAATPAPTGLQVGLPFAPAKGQQEDTGVVSSASTNSIEITTRAVASDFVAASGKHAALQ